MKNPLSVRKTNRYSTVQPLSEMDPKELRHLNFSLNFRWIEYLKRDHREACESVTKLKKQIAQELSKRRDI